MALLVLSAPAVSEHVHGTFAFCRLSGRLTSLSKNLEMMIHFAPAINFDLIKTEDYVSGVQQFINCSISKTRYIIGFYCGQEFTNQTSIANSQTAIIMDIKPMAAIIQAEDII
ncbi:MAG: hypothetical protein ACE5JB_02230 [bacterium]